MFFGSVAPARLAVALRALLWSAVAVVLLLSLAYTALSVPVADDICRSALSTEPGAWISFVRSQYGEWTGRWAAMAIYGLVFPRLDLASAIYPVIVGASLPLWIAAFWMAIGVLWGPALAAASRLKLAALLTALYWSTMPAPGETWYWATGLVEYQLPFALAVACLALVASRRALSGGARARAGVGLAAAAIAVVVGGLNELIALYLAALLAIGAAVALSAGRAGAAALIGVVLLAAIAGFLVSAGAPGNAVRADVEWPYHRSLVGFLNGMFRASDETALAWVADARFWALGALILLSDELSAARRPWTLRPPPFPAARLKWWAVVVLATLAAMLAGRGLVAWGQGWTLPGRISNMMLGFFILGVLALVAALGPTLRDALSPALRSRVSIVAGLVLVAGLAGATNTGRGATELYFTASDWRPAVLARDDALRAAAEAGQTQVEVAPIGFAPHLFFWSDLSTDPDHWVNDCMAQAFGVDSVRVRHP